MNLRRWSVPGEPGYYETRARIIYFGIPNEDVLVLPQRNNRTTSPNQAAWRDRVELGVIVPDPAMLKAQYDMNGVDALGDPHPSYGVFAEVRTIDPLGRTVSFHYLPANEIYGYEDLEAAPSEAFSFFDEAVSELITYALSPNGSTWRWSGSNLYDRIWSHSNAIGNATVPIFTSDDRSWIPGLAGAHERVLLGSGDATGTGSHWLLYALGPKLLVEFWRDGALLANRVLDLSEFAKHATDSDDFVIAMGYDFEEGSVSLGVLSRGFTTVSAYRSWKMPELVGFGFEDAPLHVGGLHLEQEASGSEMRTAWGYIKPIRGAFTSERPLTRGLLSELMEGV